MTPSSRPPRTLSRTRPLTSEFSSCKSSRSPFGVLAGVQPCFVPPPFESQRLSMAVNRTPWEGSKVHCQGGTKQYAKYLRSSGGHTEVCVFHDLARGNLTTCRTVSHSLRVQAVSHHIKGAVSHSLRVHRHQNKRPKIYLFSQLVLMVYLIVVITCGTTA